MTSAGWKRTTLALIAAGGVAAFVIYTLGWHNSDAGRDGTTDAKAEAIDAVRLRANQACEAQWWGDDYCVRRVKATRFTAEGPPIKGLWLVREHVRGDQPFQDTCWVVEPERLSRRISGWAYAGLSPALCECPPPSKLRLPVILPDGRKLEPDVARIVVARCRDRVSAVVRSK
jgi:hypothetical protein